MVMNKDATDDEYVDFEKQQAGYKKHIGGDWKNFQQLYVMASEFAMKLSTLGWLAPSKESVACSTLRVAYITYAYTMGYSSKTIDTLIAKEFNEFNDELGGLTRMIESPVVMHRIKTVIAWTKLKLLQCAKSTDSGQRRNLETLFQHEFLTGQFYPWLRELFSEEQQCTLKQALEIEWEQYMKCQCPTGEKGKKCLLFQRCTHRTKTDVDTKVELFLQSHQRDLDTITGKGKDGTWVDK